MSLIQKFKKLGKRTFVFDATEVFKAANREARLQYEQQLRWREEERQAVKAAIEKERTK